MNEQQRVTLAIVLSMAILIGYQLLAPPPPAPLPPAPPPAASTQTKAAAPGLPAAAAGLPDGSPPAAAPPLQGRDFQTAALRGRLLNQQAGLAELNLVAFSAATPRAGDANGPLPLSLAAPGAELQGRIDWLLPQPEPIDLQFVEPSADATTWLMRGRSREGLEVEVEVRADPLRYALLYSLRAHNAGSRALPVGASVTLSLGDKAGGGGSLLSPKDAEASLRALCQADGKQLSKDSGSLTEAAVGQQGGVQYAALDRQYFLLAAVPAASSAGGCSLQRRADRIESTLQFAAQNLAPGDRLRHDFFLYAGPKRDREMVAVAPVLQDTVDYTIWKIPLGALARPMVWIMNVFFQWTHSWGVAIMLLTLLVKTVLLPVTYKSVVAMRQVQDLRPELDKIRARYPDDRERQSTEQMKLYRDRGVNPFGGCLPTLLQMPVWLALYRTLWSAVDLYQQPFLWLPDLTAKEPYPILAVLLGGLTILQQRLTPMATDNQQAKIMMWVMPVMLTFLMVSLPSGLVLYILVNTVLTILQHLAINRRAAATPRAAR